MIIRFGVGMLPPISIALLEYIVWINIILALFNLMPIPPLDGHWLLMTFLPARFVAFKVMLFRYQWLFLVFFLFVVFPLLTPLLTWLFRLFTGLTLG
jgi:Zn-dependent protease